MLEEPHHPELPEDPLGGDQALEDVGQLLEGHALAVAGVGDRPDHAEGAVADRPVRLVVGRVAVAGCKCWKTAG